MKGKSKVLLVLIAVCAALLFTGTTALADGEVTLHVDPDAAYEGGSAPERADGAVYNTLDDAISKANANANDTIVIDDNMTIDKVVIIDKSIVLDLGGNTLTIGDNVKDRSALQFTAGKSQLKNGQIIDERGETASVSAWIAVHVKDSVLSVSDMTIQSDCTQTITYPIRVEASGNNDAELILNDGTVISESGANGTNGTYGVTLFGSNADGTASLTVNSGVTITSSLFAISGSGTKDNTVVTINGGTITSLNAHAIYYPQEGDLTINGGTLTGVGGVQYCGSGKVTITGGTIRATGAYTKFPTKSSDQGDGSIDDGAALSLISRGGGYQDEEAKVEVSITGGNLISENNAAVTSYRYAKINGSWTTDVDDSVKSSLETVDIEGGNFTGSEEKGVFEILESSEDDAYNISGGSYSSPVDAKYLADSINYELNSGDGYSYYADLDDAMDAAAPGDEIKTVNQAPATETHTVTLDYDVRSMADTVVEVANETEFTLPDATRSGYDLVGWEDEDGDTYDVGDEIEITRDREFTAIWEEIDEGEYRIRIVVTGNGSVESSDNYADEGDRITLTVDPDRGYELYSLTITDASGDRVSYRDRGDGEYTFTMPDSRVTVRAIFVEINEGLPFVDVSSNAWYYDAVEYVYDNDLFEGMSAYIFGPNEPMNRGMLVTVLYRLEGEPRVNGDNTFSDVGDNLWYSDAVVWANSHGIVEGYNGSFRPLDNINREEMAAVMYRYAVYKGLDVVTLEENLGGFVDGSEVSDWAVQSMNWAVGQGVLHGKGANNLDPQGIATRAEVAQILMNYLER